MSARRPGLVAENDQRRRRGRCDRSKPDRQRTRQPAPGIGVPDALFAAPLDGLLDRLGVVAEDDHDLGEALGIEGVEHVLQDRTAAQRRQQLHAAETRGGPRGEDDRADRCGLGPPGHPPVIGVASRVSRT